MDSLTRRYQAELKRTRAVVRGRVEEAWRGLPDYRDKNKADFLDQVLPVVQAGQERAVSLTSAYMTQKMGLGSPVGLALDTLTGAGVRNGIDPRTVYERPFTTLYVSIAAIGFARAYEKALARLGSTADMDVAMSARDASVAFANASSKVTMFQRVADPNCCDFCQTIDGALVRSDDPAPLHNNCGCTVEPLSDSTEGVSFLDLSAGSQFGDVEFQEHGELGPVITPKDSEFTSLADLPRDYRQELAQAE